MGGALKAFLAQLQTRMSLPGECTQGSVLSLQGGPSRQFSMQDLILIAPMRACRGQAARVPGSAEACDPREGRRVETFTAQCLFEVAWLGEGRPPPAADL